MECEICGVNSDDVGGYFTGDPGGDKAFVGVEFKPQFFCWDHADKAPDTESAVSLEFRNKGCCGYLMPWRGRCRNKRPCEDHSGKCSSCGKPATHGCNDTSGLVCGRDLCEDHVMCKSHS